MSQQDTKKQNRLRWEVRSVGSAQKYSLVGNSVKSEIVVELEISVEE